MNKQIPASVDATLIQSEMADGFAHFGKMMRQIQDRPASSLPSTTNGEALRAEDLGRTVQGHVTKAIGGLVELYRLTDDQNFSDAMSALVDLECRLSVPLSAIADDLAKREA